MCTNAIEARGEEGVWLLVETVHQPMGDWRIWYHGMQSGAEYMVHEQRGTGEGSERDRVDELSVCARACISAI